jgi:hypothetical protein
MAGSGKRLAGVGGLFPLRFAVLREFYFVDFWCIEIQFDLIDPFFPQIVDPFFKVFNMDLT